MLTQWQKSAVMWHFVVVHKSALLYKAFTEYHIILNADALFSGYTKWRPAHQVKIFGPFMHQVCSGPVTPLVHPTVLCECPRGGTV